MSAEIQRTLPNPRLPWNVYGYSAVASFTSFVYGYNTGMIAPAIIFIPESIPMSIYETGMIVAIILLGAVIGSLFAGLIADALGRRRLLAWNNLVMIGSAITASLGDNSYTLMTSRFILGLGVGIASVVPSLYITEIAPTHVRGKLGAWNQLNGWTGIIVSYFVGYEVVACTAGEKCWRYMFASGAVLCIFHWILTLTFLPESPRWLYSQGQTHEALIVLSRIYGHTEEEHIIRQYQVLTQRTKHHEPACLDFSDVTRHAGVLTISIILQILQQLSGNSAILYYTGYVFHSSGYSDRESLLYNALACIPQFIILLAVVFLVDRSGRKPSLQISEFGISLALLLMGFATWLEQEANIQFWLLLAGVVLHRAAFSSGMGPVPTVLVTELLPFAIRGRGLALCQGVNWSLNFVVTLTFPRLFAEYNPAFIYWTFAAISIAGLVFISLAVPETKGASLEEIEGIWYRAESDQEANPGGVPFE